MADDNKSGRPLKSKGGWLAALRVYLLISAVAHSLWEIGQMPFYTLWAEGTRAEIAFAVVHCTAGDMIIAITSLIGAIAFVGYRDWPAQRFRPVAILTLAAGISYTIYSEWINVVVRKSWAYSDLMPTISPLETGLTPLLQWVIIPMLALFAVKHASCSP